MRGEAWASELSGAVLAGDAGKAVALTERVLASGTVPEEVLDRGLIPAMAEAGRRFEDQRFFLPELMFSARAMQGALALIKPMLAERRVPSQGRVVMGTVAGDLHDIGKNIVGAMLEGGGFEVHDLGVNVTPSAFAEGVREHRADVVGLSALLTTTMPVMGEVVQALVRAGLRDRVKVLVGGAPLTEAFALEIGADGYAPTAAHAVTAARRLLSGAGLGGADAPQEVQEVGAPPVGIPEDAGHPQPPGEKVRRSPARFPPSVEPAAPRDLVKAALSFQAPARLPRQLWLLPWATSRYPKEVEGLQSDFPSDIVTIPVSCSEPVPGGGNAHSVGTFVDAWGCTFENLQDGIIGQVKTPQLRDWSEGDRVRFPRERLRFSVEEVAVYCRSTSRFVLAGTCPRPFERLQFLRGSEQLYLDLNRPSGAFLDFLQRLHEFYKEELTEWAMTEVDGLAFMDDWGSQRSLLVAPELWRELFKPLYGEYVAIAHAHGKYAFMHSDGHISDIIPDLVEMGLDALNSQVFCMGVEELGRRFAGELTFWGELDRQQLLPRASTTDIAHAARRMKAAFHRDGGLIAQCEFGPGARPENIYAYFETMAFSENPG